MTELTIRALQAAAVVREAVEAQCFPGAVMEIGNEGGPVLREAYGYAQIVPFRRPMRTTTLFDIASLSKLTGVWPSIMKLLDAGAVRLDETLAEALPGRPVHPQTGKATVWQLLTHTAGLVPFMNTHGATREERVNSLLELPPVSAMGAAPVYSDLSFIFLGEIIAAAYGKPLEVCAAEFWRSIGMTRTYYNPPAYEDYAATEQRAGWRVPQVGEVHDERATQLGGVAGHAGVFSCAEDLGTFLRAVSVPEHCSCLPKELVTLSQCNHTLEYDGDRGLGWVIYQTREDGHVVFGHTGFTGTSLWADNETGEYCVLLTNRVHPTRANDALWPVRAKARDILFGC